MRLLVLNGSNNHERVAPCHHAQLSEVALGVICGLGVQGEQAALRFLLTR